MALHDWTIRTWYSAKNVAATDSDNHLLVNEKNVVMLTGWTDPETYLMDDDVGQIHDYLAARCVNGKQTPN
jgi:hypothetical protein